MILPLSLALAAPPPGLDVAVARRHAGLRLLPGRFMIIRQAMGVAKSRGEAAAHWLAEYVQSQKASGFVTQALQRHGIAGASVAAADD